MFLIFTASKQYHTVFGYPATCQRSFNVALGEGADPPALSTPIARYEHHPCTVTESCCLAQTHRVKIQGEILNMGKSKFPGTCLASMNLQGFGCMSRREKAKPSTIYFLSGLGIRMPFWSLAAGNNSLVVGVLGSFPPTRNSRRDLPSLSPPPSFLPPS